MRRKLCFGEEIPNEFEGVLISIFLTLTLLRSTTSARIVQYLKI